ncbi:GGDEF domain-containing protein, partial [candidate division TA06 bacterium]|nr:GGDEF domain-containing protein [candidate division TA06 bacterium]
MKILILHRSASTAGRLPKERYEKVFSEEGFHLSWASSLDTDLEHPRDSRSGPDFLVLFDLPDEISKAKKNLRLQGVPLIFIGADSKLAAPLQDVDLLLPWLQPEELLNHLKAFQRRIEWERSRNPLSGLPGGEVIQRELKDRLKKRSGWAFYVDLNDFKAYNDCYGFQRGDSVLVFLSRLLVDIVEEQSPEGSFVGHIGGDDFFLLTSKGGGIGSHIAFEFDKRVSQFYTEKDLARGYIYSTDREGKRKRFPFMTLVLTGLSLGDSEFSTVDVLSLEMARLKKTAKSKAKALQRSIFLNGNEEGGQNWVATLEEIILQSEKPLIERRAALEALG